ncbi:unnamed protein product [Nezara viridula]|uniref:Uncharacterized protein n=1 Tax=Nezara viridula TaxID=85310 RepID=A0A9P0H2H1_NEZVI|nr:unnamed protein product [Nezara viridula]
MTTAAMSEIDFCLVPEQEEQGTKAETAHIDGPRSILRWLSEDEGLPDEPQPRRTRGTTRRFPLLRFGGKVRIRLPTPGIPPRILSPRPATTGLTFQPLRKSHQITFTISRKAMTCCPTVSFNNTPLIPLDKNPIPNSRC